MSPLQNIAPPPAGLRRMGTAVTLARWRWRQHWFLLLGTLLGMIGVVVVVCTVPLLSAVMQTAALRAVLTATPGNADITLRATVSGLASQSAAGTYRFIGPHLEHNLHTYLSGPPRLEVRTPTFNVLSPQLTGYNEVLLLYGDSMSKASPHLTLLKGRLPQTTRSSQDTEIVITPDMAALLHTGIGAVITIDDTFYAEPAAASIVRQHQISAIPQQLRLHVVGLFNVKSGDPFWHEEDFQPQLPQSDSDTTIHLLALTSDQALLTTLDTLAASHGASQAFFANVSQLYWYYQLAPQRISITQFDDLTNQLAVSQAYILNTFSDPAIVYNPPFIAKVDLFGPVLGLSGEPGILETFHNHVLAAQVPAGILAIQVICLLLFFSSIMAILLVERQVEAIAMLRSRGASTLQVFSALLSQSVGLSLLALVLGLPLTIATLSFVSTRLLPTAAQQAFDIISTALFLALWNIRWYALAAIIAMNAAMALSLYRASRAHMLPAGRSGRAGRRPLWQRLNLDAVAIIVALTCYAISLYLINIGGLLDAQTQALISSPLALLAPIFLLLAFALLFLRLLPWLLSLGSTLAARGKRAVALLALAQMARSPRQAVRMTLLLALALAFASFTLVLSASQNQRAFDVAAYTVGADFSGDIPTANVITSLQALTTHFRSIPGVISDSVGFVGTATAHTGTAASSNLSEQLHAADPTTFAQTVTFAPQDSPRSLPPLLAQLAARRNSAIRNNLIPALVDATTANNLNLRVGSTFTLQFNNSSNDNTRYVVIAELPHIPTINTSSAGGILVDYASFVAVETKNNPGVAFNHIWLRTSDAAATLAKVRAAFNTRAFQLENLNDRRALVDSMLGDPLGLNLLGLLAIGATTALFLALIANLLMSWLSVRSRLISFIVLRALGAAPGEIAGVLLWEQGIVYVAALALGAAFGGLLALTVVPNLVFSTVPAVGPLSALSSEQYYALQHIVPVQLIMPLSLVVVFAVLIVICAIALGLMARVVLRPEMSSSLRLDEEWRVDALTAEEVVLTRLKAEQSVPGRRRRSFLPTIVQLAFWRLRETWFLLLVAGVGIITAVTIVCAAPLLSTITTTSGLHNVLNATPTTSDITIETVTQGLSTRVTRTLQQQLAPAFQQRLGAYLSQSPYFSATIPGFTLAGAINRAPTVGQQTTLQLVGASLPPGTPHFTLLQGHMPSVGGSEIEALLTPETAHSLHVGVGSLLSLRGDCFTSPLNMFGGKNPSGTLKLRIGGLFEVLPADAAFWHGEDFQPVRQQQSNVETSLYTLLVPSDGLLAALDSLATASHVDTIFSPQTFHLRWDYYLDTSRVTIDQLDDLNNQLLGLQTDITSKFAPVQVAAQSGNLLSYPYLDQVNLYNPVIGSYALPDKLSQYSSRIAVLNIPVAILTLQIVALILFFVSLTVTLLVERQTDAIAILRSRGASGSQAFGAMLIQGVTQCLIALVAGPLLAIFIVPFIAQRALPGTQEAVKLVTSNTMQALLSVGWYAGVTVLVAFIVISLLLRGQSGSDVLAVRREAARSTKRPVWQRLRLDAVAIVIAFTGYGLSLYIASYGGLLDASTRTLVAAPLALIAPIFLLIGGTLLFLRLFPYILRLAAWLSGRNRGATSMLAFAHMARSPRQTMRMTLLLAFATAFAIFTLIFSASQYQHNLDVAAYETGADFSGDIVATSATNHLSLAAATANYRSISGVSSVTTGFSADGGASGASPDAPLIPLHLMAVDSSSFAQTAIWTPQDSHQSLSSLMQLLMSHRSSGLDANTVPVIVDEAAVKALNLFNGARFTVQVNGLLTSTDFVVVAIVQHIPTVNNNMDGGNVGDYTPPGGLLMDYTNVAAIYKQDVGIALGQGIDTYLPVNHVWLRTSDDPVALAHIRASLQSPTLALANLYDRRALASSLSADPLTLDLAIILLIGAATALLLALVGDLLASWLSVRTRLTSFAVLRALGAAPLQIARVLLWEQAAVYATALLLGVIFGALLATTVVPTLIFTGVPASGVLSDVSSGQFYIIQHILPTSIIVPVSLEAVFITLVIICVVALALMARVVLRPSMSQALRLSED